MDQSFLKGISMTFNIQYDWLEQEVLCLFASFGIALLLMIWLCTELKKPFKAFLIIWGAVFALGQFPVRMNLQTSRQYKDNILSLPTDWQDAIKLCTNNSNTGSFMDGQFNNLHLKHFLNESKHEEKLTIDQARFILNECQSLEKPMLNTMSEILYELTRPDKNG